jgi:hypothetical protein
LGTSQWGARVNVRITKRRIAMRQHTTPEQTANLIRLGFEKPKNERWVLDVANESTPSIQNIVKRQDYSIGELIEMLPIELEDVGINTTLTIHFDNNIANVEYIGVFGIEYSIMKKELIDALYDMIVKLKEEGVI